MKDITVVLIAAEAAREEGRGKKAVVAAAVAAILDLADPAVKQPLEKIASAQSWREARLGLTQLGLAGELLANPQSMGIHLPSAPCARPMGRTNWGLPNINEVAEMLLSRCKSAQPTRGNGWELVTA